MPPAESEPVVAKARRLRKKDNGDGAVVEEVNPASTSREAFNTYRELFGVDAAMEDGPKYRRASSAKISSKSNRSPSMTRGSWPRRSPR